MIVLTKKLSIAVLAAIAIGSAAVPTPAAEPPSPSTSALMRPANAFARALNAASTTFPADAFTEECDSFDEFPPFSWDGRGGCRKWYATLVGSASAAKHRAFLALHITLTAGTPKFLMVENDHAYFVSPSSFTYVLKGRTVRQTGEWLVVEQKVGSVWKIRSHSWAITSDNVPVTRGAP